MKALLCDALVTFKTHQAGAWDTGRIARHKNAEVVFDRPGTFRVICRYHPKMTAEITVGAA